MVSATAAHVDAVKDKTTGTISGALTTATVAGLLGLPTGENLAVTATITDTAVTAGSLLTIAGRTTGKISLHTNVNNINGSAADIISVFDASKVGTSIGGLDENESVSISGGATVAQLNTISSKTSGAVTATITDSVDSLLGITETTNSLTLIVNDTVVDAAKLISLDTKMTEAINFASGVTTLSGTLADINTVMGSAGIDAEAADGLGLKAITVTDSITIY